MHYNPFSVPYTQYTVNKPLTFTKLDMPDAEGQRATLKGFSFS